MLNSTHGQFTQPLSISACSLVKRSRPLFWQCSFKFENYFIARENLFFNFILHWLPLFICIRKKDLLWPNRRTLSLQLSQRGSWATTLLDTLWEGRWVLVKPNRCWWEGRPEMAELSLNYLWTTCLQRMYKFRVCNCQVLRCYERISLIVIGELYIDTNFLNIMFIFLDPVIHS